MVKEYAREKGAPLVRNLIFVAFGGVSAERYVLSVLEKVKPMALQDALLVQPFEHVEILITFITQWAQNVQPQKKNTSLLLSVLIFFVNVRDGTLN
jgi:U3 small nucleolar RNA-associated protein 12